MLTILTYSFIFLYQSQTWRNRIMNRWNALVEFVFLIMVTAAFMRHATEVSRRRQKGLQTSKKMTGWMIIIWLSITGWMLSFAWRTFANHLTTKQLLTIGAIIGAVVAIGPLLWALEEAYQAFLTRVLRWPKLPEESEKE